MILKDISRQAAEDKRSTIAMFKDAGVAIFAMAAFYFAVALMSPAFAGVMEQAQQGKVLDVQYGHATVQQSQQYGSYQQNGYNNQVQYQQPRGYVGSTLGGLVGSVLGVTIGRHSSTGRAVGGFGGAAVGAAIGNSIDQRRYAEQQRRREVALEQEAYAVQRSRTRAAEGAQVIVSTDGGRTVAVFVHDASRFYPGQKVWMIGNDQILPAN